MIEIVALLLLLVVSAVVAVSVLVCAVAIMGIIIWLVVEHCRYGFFPQPKL